MNAPTLQIRDNTDPYSSEKAMNMLLDDNTFFAARYWVHSMVERASSRGAQHQRQSYALTPRLNQHAHDGAKKAAKADRLLAVHKQVANAAAGDAQTKVTGPLTTRAGVGQSAQRGRVVA